MNIYKEVVNRNTIPPSADPDGLAKFHAEKLTASALTQTYHYMMEGGLEYGLLTTGEATVFLKVDWAEAPYIVLSLGRARARGLGSSRACAVQLRGGTVSRVQAARFPPSPLRNPATAREIPRERRSNTELRRSGPTPCWRCFRASRCGAALTGSNGERKRRGDAVQGGNATSET